MDLSLLNFRICGIAGEEPEDIFVGIVSRFCFIVSVIHSLFYSYYGLIYICLVYLNASRNIRLVQNEKSKIIFF